MDFSFAGVKVWTSRANDFSVQSFTYQIRVCIHFMLCTCTSRAQFKNDDKHVRYIYDRVAFLCLRPLMAFGPTKAFLFYMTLLFCST